MEPKYRLEYENTADSEVFRTGMTKQECTEYINQLIEEGLNPNHFKIVRES
tara:strand:- start:375 stop:527 length:153 start_codon:yes stop_codon:yes gene_type:complete